MYANYYSNLKKNKKLCDFVEAFCLTLKVTLKHTNPGFSRFSTLKKNAFLLKFMLGISCPLFIFNFYAPLSWKKSFGLLSRQYNLRYSVRSPALSIKHRVPKGPPEIQPVWNYSIRSMHDGDLFNHKRASFSVQIHLPQLASGQGSPCRLCWTLSSLSKSTQQAGRVSTEIKRPPGVPMEVQSHLFRFPSIATFEADTSERFHKFLPYVWSPGHRNSSALEGREVDFVDEVGASHDSCGHRADTYTFRKEKK